MVAAYYTQDAPPQWGQYFGADALRSYVAALWAQGTQAFVRNIDAELAVLAVGQHLLPVTQVQRTQPPPSYVVSPTSQLLRYAEEELQHGEDFPGWARGSSKAAFALLRSFVRLGSFEHSLMLNSGLLSTNLYPALDLTALASAQQLLRDAHPTQAHVYRGVAPRLNPELYHALLGLGYLPVVSRQNYLFDPATSKYKKKRPWQADRKMWRQAQHLVWTGPETLTVSERATVIRYYASIYLEKYSRLNPQYTPAFVALAQQSGWLHWQCLRDKATGRLLAVQGVADNGQVLTTPCIGYDPDVPKEQGLYRLLNFRLMQDAIEQGKLLNMSSGAAEFKRQRGGVPFFEYHMVDIGHLPPHRQWPWALFAWLSRHFIEPAMQRYGV